MNQNCQFQSITLHISGTVDHIIRFLVHRCKIVISPGVFFIFSKFWFYRGGGGHKMAQKDHALYLRIHTSMILFLLHRLKIISPGFFFIFSNLVFYVVVRVKWQKWSKITKKKSMSQANISSGNHMILVCVTIV